MKHEIKSNLCINVDEVISNNNDNINNNNNNNNNDNNNDNYLLQSVAGSH